MDPDHLEQIKAIKELRDAGDMDEDDYKMCMKTALDEALARSRQRKARVEGPTHTGSAAAAQGPAMVAAEGATAGATGGESEGGNWPHNTSTSSSTPHLVVDASLLPHGPLAAPVTRRLPHEGNTNTGPVRIGIPVVPGNRTIGV